MKDCLPTIGKKIYWNVTHLFKPEWRLEYEGETVASLLTNKILFSPNREGSFGRTDVRIEYNRKEDASIFKEKNTNENVGRLENVLCNAGCAIDSLTNAAFIYKNLYNYAITYQKPGYAFRSQKGEVIAWVEFNAHVTPTTSAFTLEKVDEVIDPWLIALVSHYYAINQASPM